MSTHYTVVGCYEDPEEGDFVEWVKAPNVEEAVRQAVSLDPARKEARIVAVFRGRNSDVLPSTGEPKYGRDHWL